MAINKFQRSRLTFDLSTKSLIMESHKYTGFPQALENLENIKKKFHAWKNHGI